MSGVAVEGVRVERHLGVEHAKLAVGHHDQRIDLQHRHVFVDEGRVEPRHQTFGLLGPFAGKPERLGDRAAVVGHDPGRRIDGEAHDLLGGVVRHLLDVHAALGRHDEGDPARHAIDKRRQVELLVDVRAVLDVEAVDLLAGRARLHGDQRRSQHLPGEGLDLLDGLGEAHAALFAGFRLLELALAAAAGVDLGLHHPERSAELLGGLDRLLGREGREAVGDGGAERAKDGFRLIFMDVHGDDDLGKERTPAGTGVPGAIRRARG